MIIDSHGHTMAAPEVLAYQAQLIASRGNPDLGAPKISDARLREITEGHIKMMDEAGTDLMLLSPRPYHMMHSIEPEIIVHRWTAFVNDIIHRQVQMFPDRFRGVCGLPQFQGKSPENCVRELERCVKELGFVGCVINPDPGEGHITPPPGMGDEFWYPLYQKMVELDVPALIHPASCCS
jgi:4-oxalmesaconate hydratase